MPRAVFSVEPAATDENGQSKPPNTVSIDSLGNVKDLDVEEQDAKQRGPNDAAISPQDESSVQSADSPDSSGENGDSAGSKSEGKPEIIEPPKPVELPPLQLPM